MDKHRDPFDAGTVLIAWSGDGTTSLMQLKPARLIDQTWLMDNLDEVYASDPPSLGKLFITVDEIDESTFLIEKQ